MNYKNEIEQLKEQLELLNQRVTALFTPKNRPGRPCKSWIIKANIYYGYHRKEKTRKFLARHYCVSIALVNQICGGTDPAVLQYEKEVLKRKIKWNEQLDIPHDEDFDGFVNWRKENIEYDFKDEKETTKLKVA